MRHEIFELLESINPRWQVSFHSLRDAAQAYDLMPEYYDYMLTDAGKLRSSQLDSILDTVAQNRAERKMRERMMNRPSRANPAVSDELDAEDYG
jgi:hypothetical protein